MFTKSEKGYLALTLFFLAAGSGIKAYRHSGVRLGPFADPAFASGNPGKAGAPAPDSTASDSVGASSSPDSLSAGRPLPDGSGADSPDRESARPDQGPTGSDWVNDSSRVAGTREPSRSQGGKPARSPAAKGGFSGKVNLNRAEAVELTQVRGIGAKTADAIVRFRRSNGPFRDLRDLLKVKGIGEKKLEKLAPYLIL
ncbi:MAG: competence protein ComEA [Fibrobacteres bacterium]|nr:competence protein ComEA [Fibrobacterota bacterium]